jgi:hypothetical protein
MIKYIFNLIEKAKKDFTKYGDKKVAALDKFLEASPTLIKIDKTLTDIEYKIAHRHPIDNCDLDDLFNDKLSQREPTLLEMFKRKIKYSYKTVLYFII